MELTELEYFLPSELIAQKPLKERDQARLLVLHKQTGEIEHRIFYEIVEYLNPGDMLIINNTKVIPARIIARKPTGGKIEILLIREKTSDDDSSRWEILTKGEYEGKVFVENFELIIRKNAESKEIIFPHMNNSLAKEFIKKKGVIPLPPYIKRKPDEEDKGEYQTVYAKKEGSIAAPTAGLHFTDRLLEKIKQKGVLVREITLHVGIGTFKIIKEKEVEKHKMEAEYFEISRDILYEIERIKKEGYRIFCVGTTSTRAMEGYASGIFEEQNSDEKTLRGFTNIFIYPGYKFKIVDALVTNFHLPKSTPLALVYSFCESQKVKKAYEEAIKKRYRFFSYGDGMLII